MREAEMEIAIASAPSGESTERLESDATEETSASDAVPLRGNEPKNANRANGGRRGRKKRAGGRAAERTLAPRYFLVKAPNNGTPELDEELQDENQAMVEALKKDRTYLIVTEWRPIVDGSVKGRPVIEKEAVSRCKT
jgi:hypothetical protein